LCLFFFFNPAAVPFCAFFDSPFARRTAFPSINPSFFKKQVAARRAKIASELLDTERSYVDSLFICVAHYYRPLLAAAQANASAGVRSHAKVKKVRIYRVFSAGVFVHLLERFPVSYLDLI
jgi:hypothetical protein